MRGFVIVSMSLVYVAFILLLSRVDEFARTRIGKLLGQPVELSPAALWSVRAGTWRMQIALYVVQFICYATWFILGLLLFFVSLFLYDRAQ